MIRSLNNGAKIIKMNFFNNKDLDISKCIKETLDKLTKRAEYEISDDYYYQTINEGFKNESKKLNCKGVAFTISQDSDKFSGHMLELSMLHNSMQKEIIKPLAYGNKKQILEYLKDKDILKKITQNIENMNKEI